MGRVSTLKGGYRFYTRRRRQLVFRFGFLRQGAGDKVVKSILALPLSHGGQGRARSADGAAVVDRFVSTKSCPAWLSSLRLHPCRRLGTLASAGIDAIHAPPARVHGPPLFLLLLVHPLINISGPDEGQRLARSARRPGAKRRGRLTLGQARGSSPDATRAGPDRSRRAGSFLLSHAAFSLREVAGTGLPLACGAGDMVRSEAGEAALRGNPGWVEYMLDAVAALGGLCADCGDVADACSRGAPLRAPEGRLA